MSAEDRQSNILETINNSGKVTTQELSDRFGVSKMTIRRDLDELEQIGLIRRFHGGAISSLGRSYEPAFNLRAKKNIEAKKAIGRKAAEYVEEGDSISIVPGTTALEFVRALMDKRNITILTSSLLIANEIVTIFSLINDIQLMLVGGIVRAGGLTMVGDIAHNTYRTYHVDKAFLGIGGISLETGLTEINMDDGLVTKSVMNNARQSIILADSSKLGYGSIAKIGEITDIDRLITDHRAPKTIVEKIFNLGVEVVTVEY
jgi:DeoR/GlpR family transcriptional regulator of sugar metabolism